jgi:hypothetical protein
MRLTDRSPHRALAVVVALTLSLLACSDGGGEAAPETTVPGHVLGTEVDPALQEALRISVDATAARDPDAYWEIIVEGCREYHGDVDEFARYFVSEQGSIDGLLRLGSAPYRVADMQLDLAQTWVTMEGDDRAWVQYGIVHATEGFLVVPTGETEPKRWLREDGEWRTTFCTFGGPEPVDSEGRLVNPAGTTAPLVPAEG